MNDDDLDFRQMLPPVRPMSPPPGAYERIVMTAAHRKRRRTMISVTTSVAGLALAVTGGVLASTQLSSGGGSPSVGAAAQPAPASSSATPQTFGLGQTAVPMPTTSTASSTPTSTGVTSDSTAKCDPAQLKVTVSPAQKATHNGDAYEGLTIAFTNTGTAVCHLSDYPGVMLVTTTTATAALNVTWGGTVMWKNPTPKYVELAPQASASAGMEWGTTASSCTQYTEAQITPPDLKTQYQVSLPVPIAACTPYDVLVTRVTSGAKGPALAP